MRKIVLASASPRRRELLSQVGITFEVKPASGEERITSTEPSKVVEELSFQKAMFTAHALEKEQADDLADILNNRSGYHSAPMKERSLDNLQTRCSSEDAE